MKIGKLLRVGWLIANAEAKHLGATEILPVHFLLAALKAADPKFPDMLDGIGASTEYWTETCKEAASLRQYIDVPADRVKRKRRALRSRLAARRERPPIVAEGMLHRSEALKAAFGDACASSGGDTLTLMNLIASLFKLELVSLDDIDN